MRAIFTRRLATTAVIAVAVTAVTLAGAAAQAAPRVPGAAAASASGGYTPPSGVIDPCPSAAPGDAGCAALSSEPSASSAGQTAAAASAAPAGYTPDNLQQANDFQGARSGSGETVAVVTAYGDSDAASDLAKYRSNYGLTPCTVADGCFTQVSQTGSTTGLPGASAGWSAGLSISMDMISAICPNCHILVVEANSSAISDLGIAENEAVALGANAVDNDWGIPEGNLGAAETTYDPDFDHPGVAITAPAGDDGYGNIDYPAASQYVTAVGGTTLTADSGTTRGYTETAWTGTGSGCSADEPKPSWQTDTGCANRMLNDLAADADPDTPVAYYDTPTIGNWGEGSGTAVAAAIIAASYALAGTPAPGTYPASYPYTNPGGSYTTPGNAYAYPDGLNNITSGTNGTCAVSYWCTAGPGYNGPTGLGSPNTALSLTSTGETGQFQVHTAADICLDAETAVPVLPSVTIATAPADLNSCDGSPSQTWTALPNGTITDTDNLDYQVMGESGVPACLGADGTTAGSPVEVSTDCDATFDPFQSSEWSLTSTGEIVNAASGLCLTDPGDATAGGTALDVETCASSPAADQQWTAPYDRPTASGPIESQIVTDWIRSETSSPYLCVDDTGDATTNGNKIQVWQCLGNANQDWTIEPDGTIQINGKCLVTDNDGTSNGTKINLYTCTGDTNQQWTERSDGTLVNTRSGTCLDDPSASETNGTQLQIWSCDGLVQQSWTLP
jgi:hypothetical protein